MPPKSPAPVKHPASTGGRRPRRPTPVDPGPLIYNPPPPEVRAQCARDNELRQRLYAASLLVRRNHCG